MIRFYTINNAWLMRAEGEVGSLEVGKRADFVVIDRDLLACPGRTDPDHPKVLSTWLDGQLRLRGLASSGSRGEDMQAGSGLDWCSGTGSLGGSGGRDDREFSHDLGIVLELPGEPVTGPCEPGSRCSMLNGTTTRRLLDPVQLRDDPFYAVSVFGLQPGRQYRFRAEFLDGNGDVLRREEFTGQTRAEPREPPNSVREIHVATTGTDSNPGTVARPKKTLAAALKLATQPGTHVVLHKGMYFEGDLVTSARGTAAAPIVVRGARGEDVILDGSDETCRVRYLEEPRRRIFLHSLQGAVVGGLCPAHQDRGRAADVPGWFAGAS